MFETPIISIAPQATKDLDQFQNVPYWVIECSQAEFQTETHAYKKSDDTWQPKMCDFILKTYDKTDKKENGPKVELK